MCNFAVVKLEKMCKKDEARHFKEIGRVGKIA
jgi:hypothetical protein